VAVSLPDRESTSAVARGRWVTGVLAFLAALSLATSLSNADAASARTGAANVALKVADIHGVPS